jgi:hypothetical protein
MDDPNKKQNDPNRQGQPNQQSPGQQQQRTPDDSSEKRPSGGTDAERDRDKQEQGGQRRAS